MHVLWYFIEYKYDIILLFNVIVVINKLLKKDLAK